MLAHTKSGCSQACIRLQPAVPRLIQRSQESLYLVLETTRQSIPFFKIWRERRKEENKRGNEIKTITRAENSAREAKWAQRPTTKWTPVKRYAACHKYSLLIQCCVWSNVRNTLLLHNFSLFSFFFSPFFAEVLISDRNAPTWFARAAL